MSQPRYLTKSRYKLALECPTKLFYTKKKEYADSKMDDAFMEALAEGGYQVGELAKHYFPGGHDVTSLDYEEAERETNELLKQDNVIIYEPAIRFNNLFIRIDILVKKGNHLDLIEVKAKSYSSNEATPFFGKKGGLDSKWKPYLYDVAFQHYVLAGVFPESTISNYLMLADKNAKCATDGLNQKFQITRDDDNRKGISVHASLSDDDLKHKVLIQVPVDDAINHIQKQATESGRSFEEDIQFLASAYEKDEKITTNIGRHCKACEFTCTNDQLKNGFKKCWGETLQWSNKDFNESNILDIWNLNYRTRDKLFEQRKIKSSDITIDDINIKENDRPGLSQSERQWLQIEKSQNNDMSLYFDAEGMKAEMDSWIFPLHFIDFETTMVALPFTKGRKPYEGIAFQFSHHTIHQDGRIEHTGEYINTNRGEFPNYDFVRALKLQLENDKGTVFRYADHENNFLNLILRQLEEESSQDEDFEDLVNFIHTITHSTQTSRKKWKGDRDMVDMLELVKKYYYKPSMKGSNSLKVVLPAILNGSSFLQEKYSKPVYGTKDGITSLNFPTGWIWVEKNGDKVLDPYKKLPKLFDDVTDENMEILSNEDELANGGAAMTAYAKMQFEEISAVEKQALRKALLRYCELDTFAMVMLYEAWNDMCPQE